MGEAKAARTRSRRGDDRSGRDAERPSDIPPLGWLSIARRVVAEIKEDQVPAVAAGLAFYAMLAIFPALIAFVSIYGLVADPSDVERLVSEMGALPADVAALIEEQVVSIASGSNRALGWAAVASIAAALWSASSGMQQLVRAVNIAYDEEETRGFVTLRALALVLTLGAMVLGSLAIIGIVVVPPLLESLALQPALEGVLSVGRFVLLALIVGVALAVVYRVAPAREDPRWNWVSWGAVIATLVWVAASAGFSFFVSRFGSYQETYGALAGVIVLLLWLFITAFVVLLGAEINAEMEHQTAEDTTTGQPRPMGERDAVKADSVAGGADGRRG